MVAVVTSILLFFTGICNEFQKHFFDRYISGLASSNQPCEECVLIEPLQQVDPLAGEYFLLPGNTDCPEGCSYHKKGDDGTWCLTSGPYTPEICSAKETMTSSTTNKQITLDESSAITEQTSSSQKTTAAGEKSSDKTDVDVTGTSTTRESSLL